MNEYEFGKKYWYLEIDTTDGRDNWNVRRSEGTIRGQDKFRCLRNNYFTKSKTAHTALREIKTGMKRLSKGE